MFVFARVGFVSRNVSSLHCHESFSNIKLKFNLKCDIFGSYIFHGTPLHISGNILLEALTSALLFPN